MLHKKTLLTSPPSGVITAMFTDIVNSTRIKGMMEGDTSTRRDTHFREQVKEPHDAIVLTYVSQSGGYIVNPTGDGFCITFVDAEEAVLCALRIQQHIEKCPITTPLGPLQIRIGLHTGMAGPTGDDYIASTVDKTARVQSQAAGGQVLVSHQTQVLVADRTQGVQFQARGTFDLKGLQSEELYQAMPLPDMALCDVSLHELASGSEGHFSAYYSGANAPSQGVSFEKRGTRIKQVRLASIICGAILICLASFIFVKNSPQVKPVLPPDSQWDGSFHFLPPMAAYDGSASLHIKDVTGENFTGTYSSENNSYQWQIEGKIKDKSIRWEFMKSIKNPGSEDAVGKAYGEATIDGNVMKGFFRMKNSPDEVASLDLRAAH